MSESLAADVAAALQDIINPRTGRSVAADGMVDAVRRDADGRVRMDFYLGAQDPASLVREVRQAAERVSGTQVIVDVKDPASRQRQASVPAARPAARPGAGRALPVMEQPKAAAPPRPSAPTPVAYPHLGRILAISSGKGGVGKSTVASNLAVALARDGARVGLMDADIYGPNLPRMMGVQEQPRVDQARVARGGTRSPRRTRELGHHSFCSAQPAQRMRVLFMAMSSIQTVKPTSPAW